MNIDQLNNKIYAQQRRFEMDGDGKFGLDDIPTYLIIIGLLLKLFKDAFIKNGKFKINVWTVLKNAKKIVSTFKQIKLEMKKL